jgi:hypothetical protein
MPEDPYVMLTGGSARSREIESSDAGNFTFVSVTGVPKHTHNSTAIAHVSCDFAKKHPAGFAATAVDVGWGINIPIVAGDRYDSEILANEARTFDRAIEKGIGRIRLIPENCHNEIVEPTRAIAEVRTIVTGKRALDKLTYVDEMGGWQEPDDAKEDTNYTFHDLEMPDVPIDLFPGIDLANGSYDFHAVDGNAINATTYFGNGVVWTDDETHQNFAGQNVLFVVGYVIMKQADNRIGTTSKGEPWYGLLNFQFDSVERVYRAAPLTVTCKVYKHGYEKAPQGAAHVIVSNPGALPVDYTFTISPASDPIQTTRAADGSFMLTGLPLFQLTNYTGHSFTYNVVPSATTNEKGHHIRINNSYRIPVGSAVALTGPSGGGGQEKMEKLVELAAAVEDLYATWRSKFLAAVQLEATIQGNGGSAFEASQLPGGIAGTGQAVKFQRPNLHRENHHYGLSLDELMPLRDVDVVKGKYYYNEHPGVRLQHRRAGPLGPVAATVGNGEYFSVNRLSPTNVLGNVPNADFGGNANVGDSHFLINYGLDSAARTFEPVVVRYAYADVVLRMSAPERARVRAILHGGNVLPGPDELVLLAPFLMSHYPHSAPFAVQAPYDGGAVGVAANLVATVRFVLAGSIISIEKSGINNIEAITARFDLTPFNSLQQYHFNTRALLGDVQIVQIYPSPTGNLAHYDNISFGYGIHGIDAEHVAQKNWGGTLRMSTVGIINGVPGSRASVICNNIGFQDADAGANNPVLASEYIREPTYIELTPSHVQPGQCVLEVSGAGAHIVHHTFPMAQVHYPNETIPFPSDIATAAQLLPFYNGVAGQAFGGLTAAQKQASLARSIPLTTPFFHDVNQAGSRLEVFGRLHVEPPANAAVRRAGTCFGFDEEFAAYGARGYIFHSIKRISEPICAPIVNPGVRLGSLAPLNFDTRHLPPELRDFMLRYSQVDFSFLPGDKWTFGHLKTYEFTGGNQDATAESSLLYMPEFQLHEYPVDAGDFDVEPYSAMGMPSYFCFFCRHASTALGQDYGLIQPMIENLRISCSTTNRKSDVVCSTFRNTKGLGKHHLFHLTQRNVHPFADYDSGAYNRRQTILLSAEDVGLMSLSRDEYQRVKRVNFRVEGNVNHIGTLSVLLIYNNRGLSIDGAKLSVMRI